MASRLWRVARHPLSGLALAAFIFAACGEEADTTTTQGAGAGSSQGGAGTSAGGNGSGASSSGGNSTGGGSTGGSSAGGNAAGGQGQGLTQAPCGNQLYQCGDTLDNDGDGLFDSDDPDCLGPCDDTEDGYHPELPGWSGDACHEDCFWDTGNGSNEGCYWDHQCDPLSVDPNYYPEGIDCAYQGDDHVIQGGGPTCAEAFASQTQDCLDFCNPLTPNGCDCFGCCELPAGSGKTVYIGSYDVDKNPTCNIDNVEDPTKCQPCTQVPSCQNDCATCELCIGKSFLPPECFDPPGSGGSGGGGGSPPQECPPGIQACGLVGQQPCPSGAFCITGCCQLLPQ